MKLMAGLLLLLSFSAGTRACDGSEGLQRYEFTQAQMGLPFRMVLYAPNFSTAEEAARQAFVRVAELNRILSDYDYDSELSALSRGSGQGNSVPVSDDLWKVLARAQELAMKTEGAFDVTIGPCVNLWRKARREKRMPREDLLAEARQAVGYRHLVLEPATRSARLLAPKMGLDLGGIAKGYALDEALAVLKSRGIDRAMVSGGGDMALGEPPPGRAGWRIALEPLEEGEPQFVELSHAAIATSGDLSQRLEIDGIRYSHILDPRTGIGLTDQSLVTVIAADGMTADSLATALSVLGNEAGLELIKEPKAAARILRVNEGKVEEHRCTNFDAYLSPAAREVPSLVK
jgi:FAD:protein FMN transferase